MPTRLLGFLNDNWRFDNASRARAVIHLNPDIRVRGIFDPADSGSNLSEHIATRDLLADTDAYLARSGAGHDIDLDQASPPLGHTPGVMDRNGIFFRLSIAWLPGDRDLVCGGALRLPHEQRRGHQDHGEETSTYETNLKCTIAHS
jgi:hypothetical protein